jgi:hypothetical protein
MVKLEVVAGAEPASARLWRPGWAGRATASRCSVRGHHEEKGYESDESDIWEGLLILKQDGGNANSASLRASRLASVTLKQDDLCLVSDLKDLAVREESRYLITFFATHLVGVEMLGYAMCAPPGENELEVLMQQLWPPFAVLPLRPSPWALFGHCKMMQLLGACPAVASNSAWLGGMCGTVIVDSQQNNRSSRSLVSCRVKVYIADSMIEVFVRGRCWSLTPRQGWIDSKLSCMELGVGQHMCVDQGSHTSSVTLALS